MERITTEAIEKGNLIDSHALLSMVDEYKDKIEELYNAQGDLCKMIDLETNNFIERLLKLNFFRIYKTISGSHYFITSDGFSLRFRFIKNKKNVNRYEVKDLMEETVFISEEQHNQIKLGGVIEDLIPVEYKVGVIPFEILSRNKQSPLILADGVVKIDYQKLMRYHFGHPISEIIK